MSPEPTRRPIRARESQWAVFAARSLARWGVRPNTISVASVVFAAAAGACLASSGRVSPPALQIVLLAGAVVAVQARLLCNLFDGMVAIEEGGRTPSGAIYNELPDRFADLMILAGAGYSSPGTWWSDDAGWLAAGLAIITAYVRALGASAGAGQHYSGPMAKPHRMAVVTAACLATALCTALGSAAPVMPWTLVLISAGCLVTIARRCRLIVRDLEAT